MKVMSVQYVPLGRPPRLGEWFHFHEVESYCKATESDMEKIADGRWKQAEAVERHVVEVETVDPVPEWFVSWWNLWERGESWARFRAHVAERAKAAAARVMHNTPFVYEDVERIIAEEMVKP